MITDAMFEAAKENIVKALIKWTEDLSLEERVVRIYNEAIDDACQVLDALAESNPEHSIVLKDASEQLRHLMTLKGKS